MLLVAADAATGVYLIFYALRRERRDKPGVLIVGSMLVLCAAALLIISAAGSARRPPAPQPGPPTGPVEQTAGPTVHI